MNKTAHMLSDEIIESIMDDGAKLEPKTRGQIVAETIFHKQGAFRYKNKVSPNAVIIRQDLHSDLISFSSILHDRPNTKFIYGLKIITCATPEIDIAVGVVE